MALIKFTIEVEHSLEDFDDCTEEETKEALKEMFSVGAIDWDQDNIKEVSFPS